VKFEKLLIANRGEIAIRVARAAAAEGVRSVAVYPEDDARCLHVRRADEAVALRGRGAAAYLDIERLLDVARATGCDAVHPGYGFLSESSGFARRCIEAGLRFVGPSPDVLELFGDKVRARQAAEACGVPVAPGSTVLTDSAAAAAFFARCAPADSAMMLKAVAGGGGRGIRIVRPGDDIAAAFERCRSEAHAAFGNGALYAEAFVERARHIEIQVIGDRHGALTQLWDRDCSLQRRNQKLIEIAPSPALPPALRRALVEAAKAMAEAAGYESLGTFEFLARGGLPDPGFVFMECNPRLQVEHTVTEALLGIDLVRAQLRVAAGESLAEIGLAQSDVPKLAGYAVQLRVSMERLDRTGAALPARGRLVAFDVPSGPGIRVDTLGYTGYETSADYDSLLAKVIVREDGPRVQDALALAARALREFRIEGVATNAAFLRAVLADADAIAGGADTQYIASRMAELVATAAAIEAQSEAAARGNEGAGSGAGAAAATGVAAATEAGRATGPPGTEPVVAPSLGRIISLAVAVDDLVAAHDPVAVIEAMKMETVVVAGAAGRIRLVATHVGESVAAGDTLAFLEIDAAAPAFERAQELVDLDAVRSDLQRTRDRHHAGFDAARPQAIAKRHARGARTARENLDSLCDPGTFVEYGALTVAAQRSRRSLEELERDTPADGLIAGTARINGASFADARANCVVIAYDATVLAGTQGHFGHLKTDRIIAVAERWRLPVVLFAEGGGGRPGDDDYRVAGALHIPTFADFARLSGNVPLVGVTSGRCFAGNAALLGCCDVIIATRDANIGMAGPAMIEGGGLGTFSPSDVGPVSVQFPNGVVDVVADDETHATRLAKQYLSYFQGSLPDWECADQRIMRHAVPENRARSYDVTRIIDVLADSGSVLPLRSAFGIGIVTALARIEGRPLGIIANNPFHLGGAIDADAADKASRFMQLCNAFGLPLLSLCDSPGFMVGPAAEETALVRHVCRMFVNAARLTVPTFVIALRKAYGLGAMAMAGGGFRSPTGSIAWPSAEFGPMGIEGAIRLAYKRELEAIADADDRRAAFDRKVAQALENGGALNTASLFEIDDVIDPADSRRWVAQMLTTTAGKRTATVPGAHLDTW
jgi:acetyl/propionyl-CoA carboxylase alpha subunit